MNATEFIGALREDFLDDTKQEFLWSDAALLRFLNEAMVEANERAAKFYGEKSVSVLAGADSFKLPCNAVDVASIQIDGKCPLAQMSLSQLEDRFTCCWFEQEGEPLHYLLDGNKVRLHPKPLVDTSFWVKFKKQPDTLDINSEIPFSGQDLYHLYCWCAYRAFMKPDIDTFRQAQGAACLQAFERHFGKAKSALVKKFEKAMPKGATIMLGRIA